MKHAVLITAHAFPSLTRNLMHLLDDDRFVFYLLVDKKTNLSEAEFIPELRYSEAKILPRITINWGGYSQIHATFLLLKAALSDDPDYLHFVQGADLPLKNPEQFDTFFSARSGDVFMDINTISDPFANYKALCKHFLTDTKYFRTNRLVKILNHSCAYIQKPFMKLNKRYGLIYDSSALWSIPRNFAKYVLSQEANIHKQYKYSLAADEVFLSTICMNSEWRTRVSPYKNVRLIDWEDRDGNSPKTFTIADKDKIQNAIQNPSYMFARKFNPSLDSAIIDFVLTQVENLPKEDMP